MYPVLSLTIRQLTGTRRQAILWIFAAAPLAMSILIRYLADDYTETVVTLFNILLIAVVLPLVVAILATTALGEDVEDRTLSYLVLRPVPRWQIVAAKYIAVVILGAVPLVIFGVAMAGVAFAEDLGALSNYDAVVRPMLGVAAAMAVGVLAYSAVFTWLGLVSGQALGLAIVYVFVWEGLAATIFTGIRYLSIRSYSLITMTETGGDRLAGISIDNVEFAYAAGAAAAIVVVFLGLTLLQLKNMDVP